MNSQSVVYNRSYDIIMKRVNFYLPKQDISELKALSEETGISASEHLRRALSEYFKSVRANKQGLQNAETQWAQNTT